MPEVVVVGAGVMGLLTARELALAGFRVTVVERGVAGAESSWAGGGIVSPLYPWRYPPAVTALVAEAQAAYPALAAILAARTGIDPEYFPCGLLMLGAEDAAQALAWASAQPRVRLQALSADEVAARLPGLASLRRQGLWMPDIANVRNPRLLQGLVRLVAQEGVTVREHAPVTGWRRLGERMTAVVLDDGSELGADAFVVCGGAWSASLLAAAGVDPAPPVRPVRGQMILYRRPAGELPCIVLMEGRYVIPRRDGHVLCGSTLEETGFDKSTTAEARASLEATAARLWPPLAGAAPVAHWAGLRPGSPEGIPFIGQVPGTPNLWVNAGHHRNGLVLAPASARLLADQLAGRTPQVDPRPYQLRRC